MPAPYITKGHRIRASWLVADDPPGCLAGMQLKITAKSYDVTGVCRHFRGDDPVNPTRIMIYIDPDPGTWTGPLVKPDGGCSCPPDHPGHVAINPDHIVAVNP